MKKDILDRIQNILNEGSPAWVRRRKEAIENITSTENPKAVKNDTDKIRKALEDAHNSIMTLRNNDDTSYTARKHADKLTKILRGHIDSLL